MAQNSTHTAACRAGGQKSSNVALLSAGLKAEAKLSARSSSPQEAGGGERPVPKPIPVVGRIRFLVVVGLKSLLPCWLSAGGQS